MEFQILILCLFITNAFAWSLASLKKPEKRSSWEKEMFNGYEADDRFMREMEDGFIKAMVKRELSIRSEENGKLYHTKK